MPATWPPGWTRQAAGPSDAVGYASFEVSRSGGEIVAGAVNALVFLPQMLEGKRVTDLMGNGFATGMVVPAGGGAVPA